MALLATKLHFPSDRPNLVPRPRLLGLLDTGLQRPLTLVSAPAGYGKTTLLSAWIVSGKYPVAWISLDSGDNDPYRFLSYLVAALSGALPNLKTGASLMLQSSQPLPPRNILDVLINDLSELQAPFAVVLDDYQFIEDSNVNDILVYLLDHRTPQMRLVIATRSDPLLPLARLRGRNQLTEIRTDDLRFTTPETVDFLNRVMGLNLTRENIAALETRTEGWIAGLQMAALALHGRQDASEFIQIFSGSHRFILEYLCEEVLNCQSNNIRSFLLYTSILDRLSSPLCDAVIGQASNSQEILELLGKVNLFVVPLDEEHQWYRYHHLFADLLRAKLQQSFGLRDVAELHLRAAKWYEQNELIQESISHALAASDFKQAGRLIEENYMAMLSRGEMTSISFWAGKLPTEFLYEQPKLSIYEAQSRSWLGQLEEAELLCKEAEKRIRSGISTSEAQPLLGHLAYVQSRIIAMQGNILRAIELCLQAQEKTPGNNVGLQLGISVTLGYEYYLSGDFTNACEALHDTIRMGSAAGDINITIAAFCVLARLHIVQGQLFVAHELFQKAEQVINHAGGKHLGAMAVVEVGIADVLCERNELEAALVHIKRGLDYMPLWGKADDWDLAFTTLSRIHLAQGDRIAAADAMEKAVQIIQARGVFHEARSAVESAQVKLWLAQDNWQSAVHWAASLERGNGIEEPFRFENELAHIAQARVFLARNKPEEAMRLLSHLEEAAQSGGRMGRLVEILILQAMAAQMSGNSAQACGALAKSLTLAEPEGYMRLFLDEETRMKSLIETFLSQAKSQVSPNYPIAYAEKLISAFPISIPPPHVKIGDLQSSLVDPLSPREIEVLKLMCEGYANQEIAEKLIISMNTVKRHNNNIFRKLDASNRAQAIVRAYQLGLVKDHPT